MWYIIVPDDPKHFRDRLLDTDKKHGRTLWRGLAGFFPYDLKTMFPADGSLPHITQQIMTTLFQ